MLVQPFAQRPFLSAHNVFAAAAAAAADEAPAEHRKPKTGRAARGVTFADTRGKSLVDKKEFQKDKEPIFCGSLRVRKVFLVVQGGAAAAAAAAAASSSLPASPPEPATASPASPRAVMCKLLRLDAEFPNLSGVVRVRSAFPEKEVFVRITGNGWANHQDLPAFFARTHAKQPQDGGEWDEFVFSIRAGPHFEVGQRIEFAVGYRVPSLASCSPSIDLAVPAQQPIFWDNNEGRNYVVDLRWQMCLPPPGNPDNDHDDHDQLGWNVVSPRELLEASSACHLRAKAPSPPDLRSDHH
jgi:hypothetical protein